MAYAHYLVTIIDWYSRKVLSWRISNSMDAWFCVERLECWHQQPGLLTASRSQLCYTGKASFCNWRMTV